MPSDTLSAIAEIVMGQSPSGDTCNEVGQGLPLLNGPTEFGSRHPTPVQFTSDPRKRSKVGDILFCVRGSTTGRMNWADREYAIGRGIAAIRHKTGPEYQPFLKALVDFILPELLAQATGSTFPNVSYSQIAEIPCDIPSKTQQRFIARVLGALDDKIELNRRMNRTLEAMAQSLFQRMKDEGGEMKVIGEIAEINSWTLNKSDELERIEYVEISEVSRGDIGNIQVFQRGEEPSRARRRLRHGDTVLSTVRPERGAYFLCLHPSPNLIASTGFAVVTPTKAPWSFVHAALTQPEVSEHLGHLADGGAYPAVRPEIIGQWEVPWPDDAGKLERFHKACAPLYERAELNRQESRTLAALRDALLPKLLSGEIRVKEVDKLMEPVYETKKCS